MRNIIFFTFTLLFLTSCDKSPQIYLIEGSAQGTTYSVKFWTTEEQDIPALSAEIDTELKRIDKLISNYRNDSDIERFNQHKVADQPIALDAEIIALLNTAAVVYDKSQHCFDPTIKPLFALWGFRKDTLTVPSDAQISETKQAVGFDKVLIGSDSVTKKNQALSIDLSAIGQGYAVSQIAKKLTGHGIENYLVEIGGEMLVAGTKPNKQQWRIGVERPVPNSQQVSEVITITGKRPTAVMTSGTYRHFFDDNGKKYSHIIDPRSGKPVEHQTVAVTVIVEDATRADAWSTALLCMGSTEGIKVADAMNIPAVFYDIGDDTKILRSPSKAVAQQSENWNIKQK